MPDSLAIESARQQTKDVQQKIETVAIDLGVSNQGVMNRIAAGAGTVPAQEILDEGQRVQLTVEEVAGDLREVEEVLSDGLDHLSDTRRTLADTQVALVTAGEQLVAALEEADSARQRALHDSMTGLPNRELYNDRLTQALALAQRRGWTLSVFFLDLDGFKQVNDTHGHAQGDRVIKEVARRLALHLREEDSVCRNGGDEFLLLILDPQGRENIERIARTLIDRVAQPIALDAVTVTLGSSLGISFYPEHGSTGEELVEHADAAMYRAKKRGGGYAS